MFINNLFMWIDRMDVPGTSIHYYLKEFRNYDLG